MSFLYLALYFLEGILIISFMEMRMNEAFYNEHKERMNAYLICSLIWPFVIVFLVVCAICMIPALFIELSDYVIYKKRINECTAKKN